MRSNKLNDELFKGLHELAASSFPKTCKTCGRVFKTSEQFLTETQDLLSARSCLKQAVEDDGSTLVEVFRNCPCGSTLMDEFSDRRDLSEKGLKRRKIFERMQAILIEKGIDADLAKSELIKAAKGKRSDLLEKYFRRKVESK
jgi:pyruvate/2-oxoacid:ferredoxin oxidoreductase beta subunit